MWQFGTRFDDTVLIKFCGYFSTVFPPFLWLIHKEAQRAEARLNLIADDLRYAETAHADLASKARIWLTCFYSEFTLQQFLKNSSSRRHHHDNVRVGHDSLWSHDIRVGQTLRWK